MVIPSGAPLSRCLTLIESVQKQQFTRHIPEDFNTLLNWSQPLKLRGYQKWDAFCEAVHNIMANTMLPADGKGVMVALRPAPGLRVEPVSLAKKTPINATHDGRSWRRTPEPHRLSIDGEPTL